LQTSRDRSETFHTLTSPFGIVALEPDTTSVRNEKIWKEAHMSDPIHLIGHIGRDKEGQKAILGVVGGTAAAGATAAALEAVGVTAGTTAIASGVGLVSTVSPAAATALAGVAAAGAAAAPVVVPLAIAAVVIGGPIVLLAWLCD
jgi:hypothetical protein